MMLLRIVYDGVRARSGDHPLTGADLFVGANGSGKSTTLDVVRLGLLGPSDALDTDRVHIAEPAGTVSLYFDTADAPIVRDIGDRGEGSKLRAQDLAEQVEAVVGRVPLRHDLRGFAGAPREARAALLRSVVGTEPEGWTPARAVVELADVAPEGVMESFREAMPATGPLGDWMERAVRWAESHRTAAQEAERHAASVAKRTPAPEPRPLCDVDAIRERLAEIEVADRPAERVRIRQDADRARAHNARLAAAVAAATDTERAAASRMEAAKAALASSPAPGLAPPMPAPWVRDPGPEQRLATARGVLSGLQSLSEHTGATCRHCGGDDPSGLAERIDAAYTAVDDAERAVDAAEARGRRARAEADDADRLVRSHRAALAAHEAAKVAVDTATEAWRAAREALSRQQSLVPLPVPEVPEPSSELDAERASLRGQIAAADAHERALADWRRADLAKSRTVVEATQARQFVDQVRGLRSRIAAQLYAPIREAADGLLAAAEAPVRLWLDSETDWGGVKAGGAHVHYWDLSEAERALVGAGLAVGCAVVSGARWRVVIMDGMDAIHPVLLPRVLRALADGAARGDWQFIGAATHAPDVPGIHQIALPAPEGWIEDLSTAPELLSTAPELLSAGPGNLSGPAQAPQNATDLPARLHAALAVRAENERAGILRKAGISALPTLAELAAMTPRIHSALARRLGMEP